MDLINVSRDKYHVSTEEATRIAAPWDLGSGTALGQHDAHSFRTIFEVEASTLLYYRVRTETSGSGSYRGVGLPDKWGSSLIGGISFV